MTASPRETDSHANLPALACYNSWLMELLTVIATSWPFAILVLAILFFLMFRPDIKNLLSRTTRIGPTGLTASETRDAQAQAVEVSSPLAAPTPPGGSAAAADPADALVASLDDSYIRQKEQELIAELNGRGITDANPKKVRVLTRVTAALVAVVEYERADANIWGSQLQILAELNSSGPLPTDRLRPFYETAKPQAPDAFAGYPFEKYMEFLKIQGLVTEADRTFTITDKGKQYLVWRVRTSKPARKIY